MSKNGTEIAVRLFLRFDLFGLGSNMRLKYRPGDFRGSWVGWVPLLSLGTKVRVVFKNTRGSGRNLRLQGPVAAVPGNMRLY